MELVCITHDGEFLIVQTSEGIGKIKSDIKTGFEEYNGLVVNSFEDLERIKDEKLRSHVELAFLDSIKSPWRYINKNAKDLPRPLSVIYTKENGFKEFLLLSLDAQSIIKALWANKKIYDKIKDLNEIDDEGIIIKILNEVEELKKFVDFDVRVGINVCGDELYKDEKYVYETKILDKQEHYGFLVYLVDKYNLVFVQNPFEENDKESFVSFMKQVKHMCLVCSDTKNGLINNSFMIKDKFSLKNLVDELKKLRINPVLDGKNVLDLHLAVGFQVPMLKHNMINWNIYDQYQSIEREIKEG